MVAGGLSLASLSSLMQCDTLIYGALCKVMKKMKCSEYGRKGFITSKPVKSNVM